MANELPEAYQELIWDWTWNRLKVDRLQDVEDRFGKKFVEWPINSRNKLTTAQGAGPDIPIYTGSLGLVVDAILDDVYQNWNLVVNTTTESVLSEEYVNIVGGVNMSASISGTGTVVDPYVVTLDSTYVTPSDEYVNNISFNISTGDLTLGRNIGLDLTDNLDGRYALLLHAAQHEAGGSDEIDIDGGTY